MSRQDVMNEAHRFEDEVVLHLRDTGMFAGLYGNRLADENVQEAMRLDGEGYLLTRNVPDIFAMIGVFSFFIDAKKSHHERTGCHLVDEEARVALVEHEKFSRRPSVIAFWHQDGRIGFQSVHEFTMTAGPLQPTVRNSEAEFYRLTDCNCDFDALTYLSKVPRPMRPLKRAA